jgi:hypothetical protein
MEKGETVHQPGTVFAKSITLKNGRVIYAENYGLRAFCFRPRPKTNKR